MEIEERRAAKAQLVKHMLQGQPWHVAVAAAGLHVSRSTAYRLLKRVRTEGEAALTDGRHGHPTKLRYPPSDAHGRAWWMEDWEPTPTPSTPTEPKLIPIVTTAPDADPVALGHLYRQRWPVQENILKDWLLPLGLDTNHGFAKTPVENSEVAKRREALERRLANIQRWAPKAHERAQRAGKLAEHLRQETKAHSDALYRRINGYICEYDTGNEREWRLQHKPVVKAMQAEADADLDTRWRRGSRGCGIGRSGNRPSTRATAWNRVTSCAPCGTGSSLSSASQAA